MCILPPHLLAEGIGQLAIDRSVSLTLPKPLTEPILIGYASLHEVLGASTQGNRWPGPPQQPIQKKPLVHQPTSVSHVERRLRREGDEVQAIFPELLNLPWQQSNARGELEVWLASYI